MGNPTDKTYSRAFILSVSIFLLTVSFHSLFEDIRYWSKNDNNPTLVYENRNNAQKNIHSENIKPDVELSELAIKPDVELSELAIKPDVELSKLAIKPDEVFIGVYSNLRGNDLELNNGATIRKTITNTWFSDATFPNKKFLLLTERSILMERSSMLPMKNRNYRKIDFFSALGKLFGFKFFTWISPKFSQIEKKYDNRFK